MPVKVQGPDGNTYQFPDGTDKNAAVSYFKKKGIGTASSQVVSSTAAGPKTKSLTDRWNDFRDKLTTPTPHGSTSETGDIRELMTDPKAVLREVGTTFSNIGAGGLGVILHPVDTAKGILRTTPPGELYDTLRGQPTAADETGQALREHPLETIEQGIGQAAVMDAAPEAVKGVVKGVKGALRPLVEGATGTTPRETANLAKETQAANDAATKKIDEAKGNVAKTEALKNKVEEGSKELRGRIETSRENALKEGNSKYNAVNEELNPVEADFEKINNGLEAASEKIKGSQMRGAQAKPPILEDIGSRIQKGDSFNYEDLQGYYSELGNELSKGGLPGDVYAAYDTMHDAVGDEMQRIADSKGFGSQLSDARNYWRRMKQTFGKSRPVSDAATKTFNKITPEFAKKEALDNSTRMLSHYDPEIGRVAGDVSSAREELKGVPKPSKSLPEVKQLGAEDIRSAKEAGVHKNAELIRRRGTSIAVYVTGYRSLAAIARAAMGDTHALAALPADVGEGVALVGGAHALARVLESPKVLKMLTEPNARDIAQIPPEMRSGLQPVIEAAQKKGIKVSPALIAAVAGSVGPKTKELQATRDKLRNPSQQ